MKPFLLLLLPVCMLLSSCNLFSNYGKKVEFGESEVFYKGDGVTEKQAKAVGNFLSDSEWFTDKAPGSAQLTKEDGSYMVRLVVANTKSIAENLRIYMWKQQYKLCEDVFDGKDARFVFTDDKFKDLDILEPVARIGVGKSSVFYDNSEYRKKEGQRLANFLKEKAYLSEEKSVDVFLVKEDEVPVVRLIVDKDLVEENEQTVMETFSYWQSLIQENVLNDKKAKVVLATVKMEDFKRVPKLTEEVRARIEGQNTEQTDLNTVNMDSVSTQTTVSGIERIKNN